MAGNEAHILVIDDEIGMREGCRRALIPHGFQVVTAEHGAEGLRLLREQRVDLVLVDAMMPGMGGLELLERIYELDPDIVTIMITGFATVDLAAQAMKKGAHDFLPKPFTSDELLAAVGQGLAARRRRIQTRRQQEDQELERVRQEAAKLDAIESRFMLILVHELRNPAGVIKNYLQLMQAGYVDDDEWDEYLEKLDLRASQLVAMLDDLFDLAHLKSGGEPARLQSCSLAEVLEKIVQQVDPKARTKGLDLVVQIQARPTVLAQPAHLKLLWSHLLENAILYTPSGRITVSLDQEPAQIVCTVADTGIGISNEELTRIFQEFYRSERAKEQAPLGTGLGLSIVDQIVKNYQGRIEVESTAEGGSRFTILLPSPGSAA
jgi:signal transduction histidine kinase